MLNYYNVEKFQWQQRFSQFSMTLLVHIDSAMRKYGILFKEDKSTFGLFECNDLQRHCYTCCTTMCIYVLFGLFFLCYTREVHEKN